MSRGRAAMMSMTGYGSASLESEDVSASVWLRSVNHRYLDVATSAPRRLAFLEPLLKERVAARVRRGRVELSLRFARRRGGDELALAPGLVGSLVRVLRDAREEHGLAGEVSVSDILRVPGAIEVREAQEAGDETREAVLALVARALDGLDELRRFEGARLAGELGRLLDEVDEAVRRLAQQAGSGRTERLEALRERARALVQDLGLEEPRLYAELTRLVDRADVAEELQRLDSHAQQARALLQADDPVGKRLDFLGQELMREANTLGSKAVSAAMVHEVVALKACIERWREQVQNVE